MAGFGEGEMSYWTKVPWLLLVSEMSISHDSRKGKQGNMIPQLLCNFRPNYGDFHPKN